MPALHHESDDMAVLGKIKEALIQRIGADRYGLWFQRGVEFRLEGQTVIVEVASDFALQRLRVNYFRHIESAVSQAMNGLTPVKLQSVDAERPHCGQSAGASDPAAVLAFPQPINEPAASNQATASTTSLPSTTATKSTLGAIFDHDHETVAAEALPKQARRRNRSEGIRPLFSLGSELTRDTNQVTNSVSTEASPSAGPIADGPVRAKVRTPTIDVNAGKSETGSEVNSSLSAIEQERTRSHGDAMTFANFAAGTGNQLAHTAAQLLTSQPSDAAPICFWGATGTGKTHLLHAIRHELRHRHRMQRVILLSAEDFTNDFLTAVRGAGLPAFRKRYRDVDALLDRQHSIFWRQERDASRSPLHRRYDHFSQASFGACWRSSSDGNRGAQW
jgi:chromosomal replication initiator protein